MLRFNRRARRYASSEETARDTAGDAKGLALVEISRVVSQQASFLSSLDGFYFLIVIALCGGLFALYQRQID